jgi:tRNA(fMet)-specific endonuclease VapC
MNESPRTLDILVTARGQAVVLPDEFRFQGDKVTARRAGEAVILEPIKPSQWPAGFFESIKIDDPAFVRPDQGALPPAPAL